MKFTLKENLLKTDEKHSDLVDSFAYMIAGHMAKIREDYVLLYIKKRPVWCPAFLYHWFIKRFVVIAEFKN